MFKSRWFAGGLGLIIGFAHIGVLGHLINPPDKNVPIVSIPHGINDYSSYRVRATRDGYELEYIGNNPRVLGESTDSRNSSGFFGIGGTSETTITREYTQDGARNQNGGVDEEGKLSAEDIACIEAAGGGRSSGAIVGGSLAAGVVVPVVANIPYVGWLAAGWATLLGTQTGGDLGATAAQIIEGC